MNKKTWYSIKNGPEKAEVSIYGEIGEFGITADSFSKELEAVSAKYIEVYINSPGGSVADGIAIVSQLNRRGTWNAHVDGAALSIASFIAVSANRLFMAEGALLMIHNPWLYISGDADELRRAADMLDKNGDVLINAYTQKTGMTAQKIKQLMDKETWFSAQEALDFGFADEITEPLPAAASFDLSRFRNAPMTTTTQKPNENEIEAAKAAALAAEQTRRSEIRAISRPFANREGVQALIDQCLDDPSISIPQARERLLNHIGSQAQPLAGNYNPRLEAYHDYNRSSEFKQAAVDALLQKNGVKLKNPHPGARDVIGMGLTDIAGHLLQQRGENTRGMSKAEVVNAAFTHSTDDFPLLLADVAHKSMLLAYQEQPITIGWTGEIEVPDFRAHSIINFSEADDLLEVSELGEYQHGSFGESAESITVKTHGRLFSISRQALINDDLSAFTRVPQSFARSSRRLEHDLVYNILINNAAMSDGTTLFHADHGNLAASGAALSVATLGAARAAMRKQTDVSGNAYVDPMPRYLIVPVELQTDAEQITASLVDPAQTNDTDNPAWIRGLEVIADPRLDADSTTAWYLATDPLVHEQVVRAYLQGQPRPYLEEQTGFETDGWKVKARLDVAAAVVDWRGLYKNPGA